MILSLLIYMTFIGMPVSLIAWGVSLFVLSSLIKYAEYHRIKDWWAITDSSLIQNLGLFNKHIRHVGFSSISDIGITKPLRKRLLNYGHVNVRLFLNETSINIENISHPERFVDFFHGAISEHRKYNHGIGIGYSEKNYGKENI